MLLFTQCLKVSNFLTLRVETNIKHFISCKYIQWIALVKRYKSLSLNHSNDTAFKSYTALKRYGEDGKKHGFSVKRTLKEISANDSGFFLICRTCP